MPLVLSPRVLTGSVQEAPLGALEGSAAFGAADSAAWSRQCGVGPCGGGSGSSGGGGAAAKEPGEEDPSPAQIPQQPISEALLDSASALPIFRSSVHRRWRRLDDLYLKPIFGGHLALPREGMDDESSEESD